VSLEGRNADDRDRNEERIVSDSASGEVAKHRDNAEQERGGVDWADPSVPVGDAPALPRWPLYVLSVAWVGWTVFLMVIAVTGSAVDV